MSVRIKVSYTDEKELAGVIRQLSPILKVWKRSKKREGRYKNAYASIDDSKLMEFIQSGYRSMNEARGKPDSS